jgi:hypothetical protein
MRALILADIDELHWYHGSGHADLILAVGDTADSLILEAADAYQPVVKASFRTVMWTTVELAMSWRAIDEARRTDRP